MKEKPDEYELIMSAKMFVNGYGGEFFEVLTFLSWINLDKKDKRIICETVKMMTKKLSKLESEDPKLIKKHVRQKRLFKEYKGKFKKQPLKSFKVQWK